MKRILIVIPLLLSVGCAGGFEKTLNYAHKGAKGLRETSLPVITSVCEAEIAKCEATDDGQCVKYFKCKELRGRVAMGFLALQMAIYDADAAMAIGDAEAAEAVARVIELLTTIRQQLAELGLL